MRWNGGLSIVLYQGLFLTEDILAMSDIFVKKMKNVDILKKKNSLLYELPFKHFYRFSALNPYKITDKK